MPTRSKRSGGRNWVRSELLVALEDPHNRVRANAALGLYKLGHRRGLVVLEVMARHPEDPFRASAAWAMGETGQQDLLPTLEPLSQDPDEMVRRNAVQAIAKIQDHDRMGGGKMVDEPEDGEGAAL